MEFLVRAALGVRRAAKLALAPAAALALGGYVATGMPIASATGAALGAPYLVLAAARVKKKLGAPGDATFSLDLDVALLVSGATIALIASAEPRLDGPWSASLYLLVALLAAFTRPGATFAGLAYLVGTEALLRRWGPSRGPADMGWDTLLLRAGLLSALATINAFFLRAEVARMRRAGRARVEQELRRIEEDARSYRLLGAGEDGDQAADRLSRSSVEEIQRAVHYALELMRRTLDLHTAALLWLNDAGTHLRISELSSASDEVHDAPIPVGDGVLGAIVARKERVSLSNLKPSYKLAYYEGPSPVRALLGMPILDEPPQSGGPGQPKALRGILVLDRTKNEAFTPHEEELAAQAARFCLRAIQNERVFVQLERAKVEQGKLYEAAKALGSALSEKDVLDAGVRSAQKIAAFDLAAVTLFDEATRTHHVVAGTGEVEDLVGSKFAHNAGPSARSAGPGLVAMVVQNRFPLPYKGDYDGGRQVVLTKHFPWPKLPSLLVLPLLLHERPLGTLILGAKRRNAFGDHVRPTLEVLASHLAVSLANARMVAKLEQLATTDGLTGLLNKRAMLDAGAQKIAAAARFGRKLSMLVTDIDFFKKVNDTYGHDVGDVVIKGLGEILKRQKRTTDLVARFGGEEFIVLCEQTDERGALLLAERIREELGKTTFHSEQGPVSVTCSIGLATFPEAGASWDSLFRAADEALYVSKRSGRNRVTAHAKSRDKRGEADKSRKTDENKRAS
ncbi:MAG TPA: sensor domain-containing diguanylate cyclase [Polyangiaceae bacterium]|nr:sensor domain-containing diguanylate cyclase [Polyangiaceae bacterium]